jgi:hypothetical protein
LNQKSKPKAAHGELAGAGYEPKGQKLIPHIDRDSLVAIQNTGYKIFTGPSHGIVRALKNKVVQKKKKLHQIFHPQIQSLRERGWNALGGPRNSSRCKRGNSSQQQIYFSRSGDLSEKNLF